MSTMPFRPPPKQVSKIGVPPGAAATTPGIAMQPQSRTTFDADTARSRFYTYFTRIPNPPAVPNTDVLYNGDRLWARITLTLESAGPVSVGDRSELSPVLGGAGILLPTNVPVSFIVAKGTKLYIASTSINRVKVQIEPIPWLEQITSILSALLERLGRA